ncbi:MAG: protein kinase [Candidatus Bruticola sp.]
MVPSNIGVYEVIEEVGKGPSAVVYQAANENTHKRVALKVLNASIGSNTGLITDLQRAVVVSSSLEHDNIAKVYDLGEDLSYHFIATEFIDGVALQTLIEHYKKFETDHACRIMQQVAKGLSAAHKQGIFHGNLHPGNIIIEKQTGRVIITDFGTSRALFVHNEELKNDSKRLGFIAPELVSDSVPNSQSDLFSLGATLYYMVTGERPAPGLVSTPGAALPQMPRLRAHLPKAPIWLETLIARLMVSEPLDRDCSIEDFIEEIEVGLDSDKNGVSDMAPLGENPFQSQDRRDDLSGSSFSGSQTSSGGDMRLLRSKTAGGTLGMLMRKQNVSSDVEASIQDAEKRLLSLEFNQRGNEQGTRREQRPGSSARPSTLNNEGTSDSSLSLGEQASSRMQRSPGAARPAPSQPRTTPLSAIPSRSTSVGARQSRRSQIQSQQPQSQPYGETPYPADLNRKTEQGAYPPPQGIFPDPNSYPQPGYPPQQSAFSEPNSYPQPNYPPQQSAFSEQNSYPQPGYPPQQSAFSEQNSYPQENYPPKQSAFSEQNNYPPQQGTFPEQNNYPPQQGAFPEQNNYPPQQGAFSEQNNYPPQQGAFPEQNNYPQPPMGGASAMRNALNHSSMAFDPNDPQPVPVPLSGSRFDASSSQEMNASESDMAPMSFPNSRNQSQKAKHEGPGSQQLFVEDREKSGLGQQFQNSPFVSAQPEENDIESLRSGRAMGDAVINPSASSFPPASPPKRPSLTDGPGTVRIAKQLQPKKSGGGTVVIIVALLVIVLLGGGGYYYFFFPKGQIKVEVSNAPHASVSLILQDNIIKTEKTDNGKLTMRVKLNQEYVVRVSADGFKDQDTKINLNSQNSVRELAVDMVGAPAGLVVKITNEKLSSQPKVKVTCADEQIKNNEMQAVGGIARFEVPTDKTLEITVTAPGFQKFNKKVTVTPNDGDKEEEIALTRSKGTVRVNLKGERFSQYTPNIVLLQNGKKIAAKSGQFAEFEIDFDKTYTVKANSSMHSAVKKDVKVSAAKPDSEFNINLPLNPSLTVVTNPNALVFLDGKQVGKADANGRLIVESGLTSGKQYKITCKRDGFKDNAVKLTIKAGDNNRADIPLEKAPEVKPEPKYVYEEAPSSSSGSSYTPGGSFSSSYGSGDAYYDSGSSSGGSYSSSSGSSSSGSSSGSSGSSSSSSSSGGADWGGASGGW